ncbi:MAG: transposase [Thomasclavelia sp.]
MSNCKLKPKKDSLIGIVEIYGNNHMACVNYFFTIKRPTGFYCEKCGCVHYSFIKNRNVFECTKYGHQYYLFAGTVF